MKYQYVVVKIAVFVLVFSSITLYSWLSYKFFRVNQEISILSDTIYLNYDTIYGKPKPKPIKLLSLEELWVYYSINPCYLPLLADSALWQPGTRVGFAYEDLFNDSLPNSHIGANRYLVGDFNVIDREGNNRKVDEIYPELMTLQEFDSIPDDLVLKMDSVHFGTPEYDSLVVEIKRRVPKSADKILNFLEKVWNYKMIAINREFSYNSGNLFAAGQSIVMCEACGDTLIMVGRFATSAKCLDYGLKRDADGNTVEYLFQHLPIGRSRNYYAGLNLITSKHWESGRTYDYLDILRDVETGGGDNYVVKYRDKAELSNFLLIQPSADYPDAMVSNGIHEVALANVSRGMLGTPNSIGCLRVSDFGSKFLRWWVPQNCKLFIAYNDTCYFKKIEADVSAEDYLPFKNQEEGNAFRKWLNETYPLFASVLDVEPEGDFKNGYIIDGYFYFKDEYNNYLLQNGKDIIRTKL